MSQIVQVLTINEQRTNSQTIGKLIKVNFQPKCIFQAKIILNFEDFKM